MSIEQREKSMATIKEKAKLKAKELIDKFREYSHSNWDDKLGYDEVQQTLNARKCAIIACDLKMEGEYPWTRNYILYSEVKKEIEQLK